MIEHDERLVRVLAVLSPGGVVRRGSRVGSGSSGSRGRVRGSVRGRRANAASIRLERLDDDGVLARGWVARALAAQDEEEDALGGGGGSVAVEKRGTSRATGGVSEPDDGGEEGRAGAGRERERRARAREMGRTRDETVAVGFARARPRAAAEAAGRMEKT